MLKKIDNITNVVLANAGTYTEHSQHGSRTAAPPRSRGRRWLVFEGSKQSGFGSTS
jgi:hypothetical protein